MIKCIYKIINCKGSQVLGLGLGLEGQVLVNITEACTGSESCTLSVSVVAKLHSLSYSVVHVCHNDDCRLLTESGGDSGPDVALN